MDFEPEEIKRKVTISTAIAPCEWRGHKINILDTPGYSDFVAEVKGALRPWMLRSFVFAPLPALKWETEKVWNYAAGLDLPRLAFINKMDRENADFFTVIAQMKNCFGRQHNSGATADWFTRQL